ncbi:E3 ubiquitin-protein ligase rad18 [Phlyctochytrium bullatum]|nr:E3 ubiquitin-protein ligase rad18 [Phlyctochytrium bullatum]
MFYCYRNLSLLSFGEDAEEPSIPSFKIKSSHDVLRDDRLSKEAVAIDETPISPKRKKREKEENENGEDEASIKKRKKAVLVVEDPKAAVQSQIQKLQQEIRKMDQARRAKAVDKDNETSSIIDEFRQKYIGKAIVGKRAKRTEETLIEELSAFKTKIFRSEPESEEEQEEEDTETCALHGVLNCLSCKDTFGQQKETSDRGWLAHKLKFAKDSANVFEPSVEDYRGKIFNKIVMTNFADPSDWPAELKFLQEIEGNLRCPICADFINTASVLPCRHSFCSLCIRRHFSANEDCPTCRMVVRHKDKDIRFCSNLDIIIDSFKTNRQTLLRTVKRGLKAKPADKTEADRPQPSPNVVEDISRRSTTPQEPVNGAVSLTVLEEEKNNSESVVPCPICSNNVRLKDMDRHVGSNCKVAIVRMKPAAGPSEQPDRPRAAVPYDMMKDSQLRKLLKDEGLRADGDKAMMKRRHKEWTVRVQANYDSASPKPMDVIRKEFDEWEKLTLLKDQSKPHHPFHTNSHEVDQRTQYALDQHLVTYKDHFDELVTLAARSRAKKRKLNSDAGAVPTAAHANPDTSSPGVHACSTSTSETDAENSVPASDFVK